MIVVDKLNKKILKLEKKLSYMNQIRSQQEEKYKLIININRSN